MYLILMMGANFGTKRVEMGETACLITGSRRVLARCDISVNSPAWREESEGCPGGLRSR